MAERESARKDGQIEQQDLRLQHARQQLQVAEKQAKEWRVRSAQRDKESAWLRQNLRKMASASSALPEASLHSTANSQGASNNSSTSMGAATGPGKRAIVTGLPPHRPTYTAVQPTSADSSLSSGLHSKRSPGAQEGKAVSRWLSKHENEMAIASQPSSVNASANEDVKVEQYGEQFFVYQNDPPPKKRNLSPQVIQVRKTPGQIETDAD